jgi:hypothetical protein
LEKPQVGLRIQESGFDTQSSIETISHNLHSDFHPKLHIHLDPHTKMADTTKYHALLCLVRQKESRDFDFTQAANDWGLKESEPELNGSFERRGENSF